MIIIIVLAIIIIVGLVIATLISVNKSAGQNQFGGYIKIQNYEQKVKNISTNVEDSIQTSLYNTVKKNSAKDFNPTTVKDAYIREASDTQSYDTTTAVYSGTFTVDMASIGQSYGVQYSYSISNTIDTGGSPVIISCLKKDQLKYSDFNCKDLLTQQANSDDIILQYLPYQNYSFKISPDKSSGKLVLNVVLSIPDSDYGITASSRMQTVAAYKGEVAKWFATKTIDPSKYSIKYNYTDDGVYLGETMYQ